VIYCGATFVQIQQYLRHKYRAFKADKLVNWLIPSAEAHALNIGVCGAYGLYPTALPAALQAAGIPEKSCHKAAANIVAYIQNRCLDRYKLKYPIASPLTARILREAAAARVAPPVLPPVPHSPTHNVSPPPTPPSPTSQGAVLSGTPKRLLSPSPPRSQNPRSSFGRQLRPNSRYLSPQRPKRMSPPSAVQVPKRPRGAPAPTSPPRLAPALRSPLSLDPSSPAGTKKRQLPLNDELDEDNRAIPPRPPRPPRLG
jgi:hypothetical protein